MCVFAGAICGSKFSNDMSMFIQNSQFSAGWRRLTGCPIFSGYFPQKSLVISGSLAKNVLQLMIFYVSSQPCNELIFEKLCMQRPTEAAGAAFLQKNPTYTQKSPIYTQKSPIYNTVCCSVLRCFRPLPVVQNTACNTLLYTAAHCNTLQHTSTHCSALQHTATRCYTLLHTAAHCNTLQHAATRCNTLLHTATRCNTLQHAATHCYTL